MLHMLVILQPDVLTCSTELWVVTPSVGASGHPVRLLPSIAAYSIGTAAQGATLNVTERDGDWLKVEWKHGADFAARRSLASEGENGYGWVLLRKGRTEFARPRGIEELRELTDRWLLAVDHMRRAAASDDPEQMTAALDEFDHNHSDPRIHHAWSQLQVCLAARQKEARRENKIRDLERQIRLARGSVAATEGGVREASRQIGAPSHVLARTAAAAAGRRDSWFSI